MNPKTQYLICSDLDGSLLDHQYRWEEAKPALKKIKQASIPLILNSSKTFAELKDLVKELELGTPIICENGGVVGIPEQSPLARNLNEPSFMGYIMMHPSINRKYILEVAHHLRHQHTYPFSGFADWSDSEVSEHTGLNLAQAALSKRRSATEPILWEGSEEQLAEFESALAAKGIRVVRGGGFLHIMGQVDKSEGMRLITHLYSQTYPEKKWTVLALGDSENDLEMLSAADIAGVIPNAQGDILTPNAKHILHTKHPGPKGWNEIVIKALTNNIGQ